MFGLIGHIDRALELSFKNVGDAGDCERTHSGSVFGFFLSGIPALQPFQRLAACQPHRPSAARRGRRRSLSPNYNRNRTRRDSGPEDANRPKRAYAIMALDLLPRAQLSVFAALYASDRTMAFSMVSTPNFSIKTTTQGILRAYHLMKTAPTRCAGPFSYRCSDVSG